MVMDFADAEPFLPANPGFEVDGGLAVVDEEADAVAERGVHFGLAAVLGLVVQPRPRVPLAISPMAVRSS